MHALTGMNISSDKSCLAPPEFTHTHTLTNLIPCDIMNYCCFHVVFTLVFPALSVYIKGLLRTPVALSVAG